MSNTPPCLQFESSDDGRPVTVVCQRPARWPATICAAVPGEGRFKRHDSRRQRVVFTIQHAPQGLFVERDEVRSDGMQVVASMLFDSNEWFVRWLNDDPVRFSDPLLHARLLRSFGGSGA